MLTAVLAEVAAAARGLLKKASIALSSRQDAALRNLVASAVLRRVERVSSRPGRQGQDQGTVDARCTRDLDKLAQARLLGALADGALRASGARGERGKGEGGGR